MIIQVSDGERLEIETSDARIQIEAGSWWVSELKSSDTYSLIEIFSRNERTKGVFPSQVRMNGVDLSVDRSQCRTYVRRQSEEEVFKALPEQKKIAKLIKQITELRDKELANKKSYGVRTKDYTSAETAANVLDAVLILLEGGKL